MKQAIFALVDCNNFFVSCERLFRPDLEGKPVVVLSSNDGCVVSRSQEAKALGIPMAAPAFKYRQLFKDYGVVQFSGNFTLYGDLSRRITSLLTTITPRIEVYSVDESFLDLSQLGITDYTAWGREVRARVLRYVGLPVSIGIAPTKTLAKLASDRAKKDPRLDGVLDLTPKNRTHHLQALPVENVWGIGRRLAPVVRSQGLATAADLAALSPRAGRQLLGGARGEQLVRELNGQSCLSLEPEHQVRKSIARTRTFGEDTSQPHVLESAVATFAAQAAYHLRASGQLTRRASLFLTTSRHKPNYRRFYEEIRLPQPTADTGRLISLLIAALTRLYDKNTAYHRAGVLLSDFVPAARLQTDLLGTVNLIQHDKATSRMQAIDNVNTLYGKSKVHYAAEDLGTAWQPQHHLRSPRYTVSWEELPSAHVYPA